MNHNGKLDIALKLCDEAKKTGADAVKFQTWKTEALLTKTVAQADYQVRNTRKTSSQFEMLKALELSYEDFQKVKEYCNSIGIMFLSTAFEKESLDFLIGLKMPMIKIGSGEITNIPFLRYAGSKHLPIILSTGMGSLSNTDVAYRTLKAAGVEHITLLHCTTNYPCPMDAVNLTAMQTLHSAFHCPVGYSDHTVGDEVSIAAVALGASVIEKHFTLDITMEGPDHAASTNPKEFSIMVQKIRNIEKALGSGIKLPSQAERKISEVVLKRIVAKKKISCGEKFSDDNITVKRSSDGVSASLWDTVIGLSAKKDFAEDEGIEL
ncbi:sialic acid synthase [Treponema pedis str. T A4]|uniref:Sialic acid synthase n=1 Tax=Treponema pedis str. T A4 TaxID=1291379 RepID=S5ZJH8_9SPIR|nr:sialic acid synthase [Treponema pedis str. T A4]